MPARILIPHGRCPGDLLELPGEVAQVFEPYLVRHRRDCVTVASEKVLCPLDPHVRYELHGAGAGIPFKYPAEMVLAAVRFFCKTFKLDRSRQIFFYIMNDREEINRLVRHGRPHAQIGRYSLPRNEPGPFFI